MTNKEIEDVFKDITPVDELKYEGIDHRYRSVQIILTALAYITIAAVALFLLLLDNQLWCILTECLITVSLVVNMIIVRKAWTFKGYSLREHDISYRSGIIFPSVTTTPYDRIQQVSVKQNPVSKLFNLYAVELVNGAQIESSLTIPGLTEEKATQIKSIVIGRMRHEDE